MERFIMKDISNSPDVISSRFVNTPNILRNIRTTSTPRVLSINFSSPNTSPVYLSPKFRLDSPICTINKNNSYSKSYKVNNSKLFSNAENIFNSPIIKSNKRFIPESSLHYEKPENKRIYLDEEAKNNIDNKFNNIENEFNNSNLSIMIESQKESFMDVSLNSTNDSKDRLYNKNVRILNTKNNLGIGISVKEFDDSNMIHSLSEASNFKLPVISVTDYDNFDIQLQHVSMQSLDSSNFKLPPVMLLNDNSQDESFILQYPSFEAQPTNIDSFNKFKDHRFKQQHDIDSFTLNQNCDDSSKNILIREVLSNDWFNSSIPDCLKLNIKNENINFCKDIILEESKSSIEEAQTNLEILDSKIDEDKFNFEQPSNLISDFSRPYSLPYLKNGKHADLKSINPQTANEILNGSLELIESSNISFIDCRYPYEFSAGHLLSAINCYKFSDLLNYISLLDLNITKSQIVVFYCEFSSERAPNMLRQLRKWDRLSNRLNYPHLSFPELYIIEGGYKNIFETTPSACTIPLNYVKMLDIGFEEDLRYYEALKKKEKIKQSKNELRRIFYNVRNKTSLQKPIGS